ncbi:MAG: DUF1254 domain-containing protein, partial [Desulfobacterales bacterium]|nr:DUF1254 domain-containing protein [Desulfobacterales bacterium]
VFTPDDTAVQTPNSGTPYSWMGMDLRAEPIVLTVPAMEEDRYFSVQNISSYLDNTLTGYYFFTKIKTIEF